MGSGLASDDLHEELTLEHKVQDIILRVSRVSVTDHDGNLLDLGVKSIDMLRIVAMLERDFAIEFAVAELTRHNFTSVRAICALIQRTPRAA